MLYPMNLIKQTVDFGHSSNQFCLQTLEHEAKTTGKFSKETNSQKVYTSKTVFLGCCLPFHPSDVIFSLFTRNN
jgi:hypothetical protein